LHIVVEKIEDHRVEMAVVTKLPEVTAADADDDHKSEDDEN
jgi:hypothetical protein